MGHEPFHHFGPDCFRQGGIKMMRAGENPGPVNDIIDTGGNAGRNALGMFHDDDRFNQALALGKQLDEPFINHVDFLAEVYNTCFFCC